MTRGPRPRASLAEYAYAAALAAMALAGALAPEPPRPGPVVWSGPVPVHRLAGGPGGAPGAAPAVRVHESLDLEVAVPTPRGDPHDVVAVAAFENAVTGDVYRVEAFHAGGELGRALYRFRFTPTSPGEWRFVTTSDVAALDGLAGAVVAEPAVLAGPLVGGEGRFLLTTAAGDLAPTTYNVFSGPDGALVDLGTLPREEEALVAALEPYVARAASLGFDAVHVAVAGEWFSLGARRHDNVSSTQPDPRTFRVLETLLALAHREGLFVHVWQWGDEARRHSPLGLPADPNVHGDPGGDGGVAFDRLQRHLAARLGPLPNWTMTYGFDLDEWADEDQVRAWAERLGALLPLPHLLAATEERSSRSRVFDLGEEKLPLVSRDLDEEELLDDPFGVATAELERALGRPLLLEADLRASAGDGEGLRRTLWRFALAGGVGSLWRVGEGGADPQAMATFARFWEGRLPADGRASRLPDGALALVAADGRSGVVYAEDAGEVPLTALPPGVRAVAVDARAPYAELEVDPAGATWRAPHRSDWAIAFAAP